MLLDLIRSFAKIIIEPCQLGLPRIFAFQNQIYAFYLLTISILLSKKYEKGNVREINWP